MVLLKEPQGEMPVNQEARTRPASPPSSSPTQPRQKATGLVPATQSLTQNVFGVQDGPYQIKKAQPDGRVQVDRPQGKTKEVMLNARPTGREGRYDFEVVGKPLDFTDKIREEIFAKLKAEAEKGSSWAKEALSGSVDLLLTFRVEENPDNPAENVVSVEQVTPLLADAVRALAKKMGLAEGEFFVVNVGENAFIVVEKNQQVRLLFQKGAVILLSPDGDVKILVKQHKAAKDESQLLMLSRLSLKANAKALENFLGGNVVNVINEAMKRDPKADQFMVRLDPANEEPLIVTPTSSLKQVGE
jgi:hypothetical protein